MNEPIFENNGVPLTRAAWLEQYACAVEPLFCSWEERCANSDAYMDRYRDYAQLRWTHIRNLGFCIVTQELARMLAWIIGAHAVFSTKGTSHRVLEAGAGTGWLAHCIRQQNSDLNITTNNELLDHGEEYKGLRTNRWANMQQHVTCDATDIAADYDVVLMSWPPLGDNMAELVARRMRAGSMLLVCHEECCATDEFRDYIADRAVWHPYDEFNEAINNIQLRWQSVHDGWDVLLKLKD